MVGLGLVSIIPAGLLAALLLGSATRGDEPPRLEFNRDIRPILSDRCFACHGPDENKREASLRLDDRAAAIADRDGQAAIVPGDPAASLLVQRVAASAPDQVMPPADSHKTPLAPGEIELLRRWIAEGAEYQAHWSLLPMKRPTPPRVSAANEARVKNDIDRFVLAEIERQGLDSLAPEAPREQTLRRAFFDLTGLPPSPEEIDAFLADTSPDAHERLVDRLLASPRHGERMASEWLDLARYADTHGYQMDRARPMWAYRDWVVRAFNDNLPFDRFVRWQLAGDLLPGATKDQRLATAFNRLHCQNEEGGVVEEEFRVAYVVDRVTTFGTAFLGLTLECTRCHDHKYDPLTMRDFYSLFAFFQNIPEAGQTTYWGGSMPTPTLLLPTEEQDIQLTRLEEAIRDAEKAVAEARHDAGPSFERWLAEGPIEPKVPGRVAAFDFDELKDNQFANAVDSKKPAKAVDGPTPIARGAGHGVGLSGDNGITFPGIGVFNRSTPFSLALWIRQPAPSPRAVIAHHSKAPADAGSRGYDVLLENGHVAFGLYHMFPGNCVKVRARAPIAPDTWTHLVVTYDGSSRASGLAIYLDGSPQAVDVLQDSLWKDITYADGEPDLAIGYRFRDNGFTNGAVDDFEVFDRTLTPLEAAHLAGRPDLADAVRVKPPALMGATRELVFDYFLATVHEPAREALARLRAARDAQRTFVNPIPEAMVMSELPAPKPAFILARGNYDQPTTPVSADTPSALPPFPKGARRDRAGLADWLLDPEHPLLARVTVNRYWQMLFGRGLVETSDNFGSQGATPTHPELLDWLARDFIDHGWDGKRLLRLMTTSATYRQASVVAPTQRARDVDNRWLARAPVRRLTAEMLRDQALAASGLLAGALGGPPVKPYQPDGLWAIAMGNPRYEQSHGPDLYRRSLYTFWKRTVPPPALMTFDAADRSYCTVRRQSTTTPLQALVLLNDPQFVEAARAAGERMLRHSGSNVERLTRLFRSFCTRAPTAGELKTLETLYDQQRTHYRQERAAADKLRQVGESPADSALDAVEHAAATIVALAILNHDEAVHRR